MEAVVFSDSEVKKELKNFKYRKYTYGRDNQMFKKWGIKSFPSFIIIKNNKAHLIKGGMSKTQFLNLLKKYK